jgi:hypothetical protein
MESDGKLSRRKRMLLQLSYNNTPQPYGEPGVHPALYRQF